MESFFCWIADKEGERFCFSYSFVQTDENIY